MNDSKFVFVRTMASSLLPSDPVGSVHNMSVASSKRVLPRVETWDF